MNVDPNLLVLLLSVAGSLMFSHVQSDAWFSGCSKEIPTTSAIKDTINLGRWWRTPCPASQSDCNRCAYSKTFLFNIESVNFLMETPRIKFSLKLGLELPASLKTAGSGTNPCLNWWQIPLSIRPRNSADDRNADHWAEIRVEDMDSRTV